MHQDILFQTTEIDQTIEKDENTHLFQVKTSKTNNKTAPPQKKQNKTTTTTTKTGKQLNRAPSKVQNQIEAILMQLSS